MEEIKVDSKGPVLLNEPEPNNSSAQDPLRTQSSCTIKLVDGPPLDPVLLHGRDSESEQEASEKQLGVFTNLSCNEIEFYSSFTFISLLRAARESEKLFILARVVSLAPDHHEIPQVNYYRGYSINKALFRTEEAQGMLHRLKCNDPKSGMEICGPIQYFAISPESYDHASSSLVYKAHYKGDDNDFLMKPEFRAIFRENAITPDDFKLFPLNAGPAVPSSPSIAPRTATAIVSTTSPRPKKNGTFCFVMIGIGAAGLLTIILVILAASIF